MADRPTDRAIMKSRKKLLALLPRSTLESLSEAHRPHMLTTERLLALVCEKWPSYVMTEIEAVFKHHKTKASTPLLELSEDQRKRMEQALRATWAAISADVVNSTSNTDMTEDEWLDTIISATCDVANPIDYGMSKQDRDALSAAWNLPSTQAWLREVLNYER